VHAKQFEPKEEIGMGVRAEVLPFLVVALLLGAALVLVCRLAGRRGRRAWLPGVLTGGVLAAYMLYFFRDPPRVPPEGTGLILAGADGKVAGLKVLTPVEFETVAAFCGLSGTNLERFADAEVVRFSIFLSLLDVHVNRAPMAGRSEFLGYFPGKRFFTFQEKSSDRNQHNSILIRNERTACLFNQVVGPVARRVVYWLPHDRAAEVRAGDPIGMMKFGSRLDMYFPRRDVEFTVGVGARVRAGETVVARLTTGGEDGAR
jgi:phosphatidylserine decarboxylase